MFQFSVVNTKAQTVIDPSNEVPRSHPDSFRFCRVSGARSGFQVFRALCSVVCSEPHFTPQTTFAQVVAHANVSWQSDLVLFKHRPPLNMSDEPRKRSRFDQTEPEPKRASRFDRRSRSPSNRDSESRRSRSPIARGSGTPDAAKKDPTAAAAAAAAKINASLQAKKGIQHVDVPPVRSVSRIHRHEV